MPRAPDARREGHEPGTPSSPAERVEAPRRREPGASALQRARKPTAPTAGTELRTAKKTAALIAHGEAAPPAGAAAVPSFEPFGNGDADKPPSGLPRRAVGSP